MPNVSADQHIRKGLKFIGKANKNIIQATIPLEVLLGDDDPPGVLELLTRYTFSVAGSTYHARLTEAQATYLNGQTGSLATFAKAVVTVLINSNNNVVIALNALNAALDAPPARDVGVAPGGVVPPPVVGGCTVDGDCYNCTETYCDQGFQGTWSIQPCDAKPPIKPKKAAAAK